VLELTNVLEPAPAGADASAEAERAGGDRPMLAPERQAAIRDSLKALAALAAPGAAREVVRSAESSLDGLTRELLRPMMADWLDRNLPPLVEKLLKAEIARIAGRLP
jgi:cell pole-organizing protein PopZ